MYIYIYIYTLTQNEIPTDWWIAGMAEGWTKRLKDGMCCRIRIDGRILLLVGGVYDRRAKGRNDRFIKKSFKE
jgi:hypothetical protein